MRKTLAKLTFLGMTIVSFAGRTATPFIERAPYVWNATTNYVSGAAAHVITESVNPQTLAFTAAPVMAATAEASSALSDITSNMQKNIHNTIYGIREPNYISKNKIRSLVHKYYSRVPEYMRNDITEPLIMKIISAESGGNANAISSAGAIGIIQIMPKNYPGPTTDLYDPEKNIKRGIELLVEQYRFLEINVPSWAQLSSTNRLDWLCASYNYGIKNVLDRGSPYNTPKETLDFIARTSGGNRDSTLISKFNKTDSTSTSQFSRPDTTYNKDIAMKYTPPPTDTLSLKE